MRGLYPTQNVLSAEMLDVGGGHAIHVEHCGSESGIPVVFLHGGPGSGCKADHRQFFDPERYHIVLIDQRGSGRSKPFGGVENNTTKLLVEDLERVREHFDIDQWVLFGGSWGATLALAYAESWPQRVLGMILRGSFLARRCDVEWFFGQGANRLLPQQWQRFVDHVELQAGADICQYLHDGIFSSDPKVVERVAAAWDAWSGAVVMFSIDKADGTGAGPIATAIAKARIEMHYAHNRYFMKENQLLEQSSSLPHVPTTLVHGARDLTCPADSAWLLHRAIGDSKLEILRTAGHLSSERPMIDALVRATDTMAKLLG